MNLQHVAVAGGRVARITLRRPPLNVRRLLGNPLCPLHVPLAILDLGEAGSQLQ